MNHTLPHTSEEMNQGNSPTTTEERKSDVMDWVKVMKQVRMEGSIILENVSENDFQLLLSFIEGSTENRRMRLHYFSDIHQLFVKVPTRPNEAAAAYFDKTMIEFNKSFHGAYDYPVSPERCADVQMNNGIAQPDASYRVCIPPRNSNNCVFEAALSQTIGSLVNTLRNYIIHTNDILIAAGIKVWKNNLDGSASMLFVMYLRALGTNNPVLFLPAFKSFGNQALDAGQLAEVIAAMRMDRIEYESFQGVGFGEECDSPGIDFFQIEIPRNLLTCIDNMGTIFPPNINFTEDHRCVLDLYELQQVIWVRLFD